MISIVEENGNVKHGVVTLYLDSDEDFENLIDYQNLSPGSTALSLSSGRIKILNSQNIWMEL